MVNLYVYRNIIAPMVALTDNDFVLSVPKVTLNGITYKIDDILIEWLSTGTSFWNIRDIVIVGGIVYSIEQRLSHATFSRHHNAYIARLVNDIDVLRPDQLKLP